MIILGIISLIIGVVVYMKGNSMNNSIEHQLESLFNDGATNPGDNYVTFGIVLILLGLLFIVLGVFIKRSSEINTRSNNYENPTIHTSVNSNKHQWRCSDCGNMISEDPCPICKRNSQNMSSDKDEQADIITENVCPHCGKPIPNGSHFCMHCGKNI